jgi:hypothetical protein
VDPSASQRTVVQFRLRSLFVATLVVAVLSAIAAPWVRRLQPWQQARLGVFLGVTLLLASVFVINLCCRRRSVERQSGKLLFRTAIRGRVWYHLAIGVGVLFIVVGWGLCLVDVLLSQDAADWWRWFYQPAIYAQWGAAYAVFVLWWKLDPTTIEAREKGLILRGRNFLPWERIQSFRWGGPIPFHLTLQLHRRVVNLHVNPRNKQRLDQLLHEMARRQ